MRAPGIHDTGYHPVVWYRRSLTLTPRPGHRTLLHLGAVDHEAHVWVDGHLAGHHVGGQTAITCDLTDLLDDGDEHVAVVRAHDDPHDPELPRGKQDWREEPHGIWYHRSTGIWCSVWLETVPDQHVTGVHHEFDMARARVELSVRLARRPAPGTTVRAVLSTSGEHGTSSSAPSRSPRTTRACRASSTSPRCATPRTVTGCCGPPSTPRSSI